MLKSFCNERGHEFPPVPESTFIFADSFSSVADKSERPKSLLKMHSAAQNCLYEEIGLFSPTKDPYIQRLIKA